MAEDEIIKKHTQAVYASITDPGKKWFHKLKDILQEVLIIVFAVSVSIWLHNWSEERKDRREETEFFKGLKEDLQADIKEMESDRGVLKKLIQNALYFQKVGAGASLNKDSLQEYYWIFFTQVQINPRISRFEGLKGSGKLDIIEDKKKLYNVIDLYQKIFPNIFRVNQLLNALTVDRIDPYIEDVIQFEPSGAFKNPEELIRTPKMRLQIVQLLGLAYNCVKSYTNGIDKSNEILKQIE
jgi:hypothetical protein